MLYTVNVHGLGVAGWERYMMESALSNIMQFVTRY